MFKWFQTARGLFTDMGQRNSRRCMETTSPSTHFSTINCKFFNDGTNIVPINIQVVLKFLIFSLFLIVCDERIVVD